METVEPRHARRSQVETLRAAGLRITGPRLAILRLLQHDTNHPTAEQVFRRLRSRYPSLSLATVYNTLTAFARRGLCRRVPPFEGPQRFDGMLDPHHHALCTGCGRLFDVPVEVYGLPPPPAELGDGLSVHGVQLTFQVLCASCQAEAAGGGDRGKADHTVQPTHEEV